MIAKNEGINIVIDKKYVLIKSLAKFNSLKFNPGKKKWLFQKRRLFKMLLVEETSVVKICYH